MGKQYNWCYSRKFPPKHLSSQLFIGNYLFTDGELFRESRRSECLSEIDKLGRSLSWSNVANVALERLYNTQALMIRYVAFVMHRCGTVMHIYIYVCVCVRVQMNPVIGLDIDISISISKIMLDLYFPTQNNIWQFIIFDVIIMLLFRHMSFALYYVNLLTYTLSYMICIYIYIYI